MRIWKHNDRWYIGWSLYRFGAKTLFGAVKLLIKFRTDKEFRRFVLTDTDD